MSNSPKVSIVVPVHNAQEYIDESIGSLINQTLKNIEIICIDDASSDNSLEKLNELALTDDRIKVLHNDISQSALGARKKGIESAKGEYIMFLDADDFLSVDGCENAYNKIVAENVDILQFSSEVVNCSGTSQPNIDGVKKFLKPYQNRLEGIDILDRCFKDSLYSYNLASKIIKAEICKKSVKDIANVYMPFAEDMYMYFVIAYHSKSYIGCEGKAVYHYCYGRGISGKKDISPQKLEKLCHHSITVKELKKFCDSKDIKYDSILKGYYNDWLNMCVRASSKVEDKNTAVRILYKYWDKELVDFSLDYNRWRKLKKVSDKLIFMGNLCGKNGISYMLKIVFNK